MCLQSWSGLEVPEPRQEMAGAGLVGLTAQDDAVDVAGDHCGNTRKPQAHRLGLPASGESTGQASNWETARMSQARATIRKQMRFCADPAKEAVEPIFFAHLMRPSQRTGIR